MRETTLRTYNKFESNVYKIVHGMYWTKQIMGSYKRFTKIIMQCTEPNKFVAKWDARFAWGKQCCVLSKNVHWLCYCSRNGLNKTKLKECSPERKKEKILLEEGRHGCSFTALKMFAQNVEMFARCAEVGVHWLFRMKKYGRRVTWMFTPGTVLLG